MWKRLYQIYDLLPIDNINLSKAVDLCFGIIVSLGAKGQKESLGSTPVCHPNQRSISSRSPKHCKSLSELDRERSQTSRPACAGNKRLVILDREFEYIAISCMIGLLAFTPPSLEPNPAWNYSLFDLQYCTISNRTISIIVP